MDWYPWGEEAFAEVRRAVSGSQSAAPLYSRSFKTDFPPSKTAADTEEFVAAELSSVAVLSESLRRAEFTSEDLRAIATGSAVSDLRTGAASRVTDASFSRKLARGSTDSAIREQHARDR